jgi:drug/metabolite transporter superfamily protein YnfA
MEKLHGTSLFVPLYVLAYVAAMVLTVWYDQPAMPLLLVLDFVGAILAVYVFKRQVEVHGQWGWPKAGPVLAWVIVGFAISMTYHLAITFMPMSGDMRALAVFGPPVVAALLAFSWFTDRVKKQHQQKHHSNL